jgi:heme oxygenase
MMGWSMSRPLNDAPNAGLAARLRHATQDLHQRAERTGLMAALLRGELARPAYAALLFNLQAIYAALEAGLSRHEHLAGIDFQPLYRSAALAADLSHLSSPAAVDGQPGLVAAASSYVSHLQALADREPLLLLAHAYVRYLGDLHGGQILHQRVSRTLGLQGGEGTRFYDFGPPGRVATLIGEFRTGLDALRPTQPQAKALETEARRAFQRHVELFEQLPH